MVENFILFLGALWGSWMVWAGGIMRMIPFVESLIEPWLRSKYPKIDAWFIGRGETLKKELKLIAVLCLFIGCYRAWVFEHKNAQIAMYGKDGKSEAWANYNECDKERAIKATLADSCNTNLTYQQSRNDGQQDLFNRCMLAIGVKAGPEPARVAVSTSGYALPQHAPDGKGLMAFVVVGLPNKRVMAARGNLKCDQPFTPMGAHLANSRSQWTLPVGAGQEVREIHVEYPMSVWEERTPWTFLGVTERRITPPECTFTIN